MSNLDLKRMSTPALRKKLASLLADTEDNLRLLASLWCELHDRGEKVDIGPMAEFFPAVASGKLAPGLLMQQWGNTALLRAAAGMVPEDQAKLKSGNVAVLRRKDGKVTTESVPLASLRQTEIRQVIGDGKLRTPAEQRRHLAPEPKPAQPRSATVIRMPERTAPTTRAEPPEPTTANEAALFGALGLSRMQQAALRDAARAAKLAPAELVARTLVQTGVIPGAVKGAKRA